MNSRNLRLTLGLILAAVPVFLAGCSSSSNASGIGSTPQDGSLTMMVSDASTEDWANISIKILSIALVPQNGTSNVTVYSATEATAPMLNLVQLDQLGEILENASVPVGTYTAAVVTLSANPTDIELISSADPSASLLTLTSAATTIPSSQIQVQGATGTAPNATVSVTVNFVSPVTVSASAAASLDLEFDLSHPAFLEGNMPGAGIGLPVWAVDFDGPIRHHPIRDLTKFLLRDIYGTVTSVNSDGSLTITRDFPVEPAASTTASEGEISTSHSITILPDSANGTIFHDVDNTAQNQTVTTFSTVSGDLPMGEFVRVTARYQTGGTLVAVRTWASSSFGKIYVSPEGHVLHVNTNTNVLDVEDEIGRPVHLTVDAGTTFYSGATQIGQGTAFLANLERGFKVHASVVDPLAVPLVADTVDVEIARYDGAISGANLNGFTYTRKFSTAKDDYTVTLPYISSGTANGSDPATGMPISGFKWWNFTFPTIVDSGANAISDFVTATNGGVTFGGMPAITVTAAGETGASWNGTSWAAPWSILDPTPAPLGTAATGYVNGTPNGTFTMMVPGGTLAPTVTLSTVSGSGTLVYQVSRNGNIGPTAISTITITPVDITTSAGQATVTQNLTPNTPVKVYGVPQADGSIKAYVLTYFTGTIKPVAVD